ncbi:hypothetical protein RYX36_015946 [Vicia faba]
MPSVVSLHDPKNPSLTLTLLLPTASPPRISTSILSLLSLSESFFLTPLFLLPSLIPNLTPNLNNKLPNLDLYGEVAMVLRSGKSSSEGGIVMLLRV